PRPSRIAANPKLTTLSEPKINPPSDMVMSSDETSITSIQSSGQNRRCAHQKSNPTSRIVVAIDCFISLCIPEAVSTVNTGVPVKPISTPPGTVVELISA